jgi:hypothetical protein
MRGSSRSRARVVEKQVMYTGSNRKEVTNWYMM